MNVRIIYQNLKSINFFSIILTVLRVRHREELRHRPDPGRRPHRVDRRQRGHPLGQERGVHRQDLRLRLKLHGHQVQD